MKHYIGIILKTLIWIAIITGLVIGTLFGIKEYVKYEAKQSVMDDYLISKAKIESLNVIGYSFFPKKIEMITEDGVYTLESNNYFKTIRNTDTLYGEDFETRKEVIEFMSKNGLENVKRGSLKYKGKGVYEAYDFNTKHTYILTGNGETGEFKVTYKDIE